MCGSTLGARWYCWTHRYAGYRCLAQLALGEICCYPLTPCHYWLQAKRESFEQLKGRVRAKTQALGAFNSNVQWPDYAPDKDESGEASGGQKQQDASRPLQRQGGKRNLLMADLVGAAAAHSLMVQQPLTDMTPADAAAQRKRMFVWMLKWKRKDQAAEAREETQQATRAVRVPLCRSTRAPLDSPI